MKNICESCNGDKEQLIGVPLEIDPATLRPDENTITQMYCGTCLANLIEYHRQYVFVLNAVSKAWTTHQNERRREGGAKS